MSEVKRGGDLEMNPFHCRNCSVTEVEPWQVEYIRKKEAMDVCDL
jgi:hypothetical protein